MAEILEAHGGAFEMPSRAALAPRAVPCDGPIGVLVGLPEGKVGHGVAVVFVGEIAFAGAVGGLGLKRFRVEVGEFAVFRKSLHAEVDRAIGSLVSEALVNQLPDHVNLVFNMVSGAGFLVRWEKIEEAAIFVEALGPAIGKDAQGLAGFAGTFDGFVVHIGDIADIKRLIAGELEKAVEAVKAQESKKIADVGGSVDGRSADIHAEATGLAGRERADLAGQAVEKVDRFHGDGIEAAALVKSMVRRKGKHY